MRPSGHLQVYETSEGRRFVALWRDATGKRHKKRLGKAWVKQHGTTDRGAPRWRTADGPKPEGDWLTPREAQDPAYREERLAEGRLARRTLQKHMVMLHAILKRAKRRKWVEYNAAADAERITFKRSGDFNVLTPAQVDSAAAAAKTELLSTVIVVAAYSGLRMGELRALRWRDVDFAKRSLFVRRNFTGGEERAPKSGKVRSVPMVDQALVVLDR